MATDSMHTHCADDVLALPLPPGVSGYELVDGVPVAVTPVGPDHGELAGDLCGILRRHVRENGLGGRVYSQAGYVLGLRRDPERLRAPDVSYVRGENVSDMYRGQNRFLRGAPDLAVEIESALRPRSVEKRALEYLDAGARLVWVIHLSTQTASVYLPGSRPHRLAADEWLDGEDVLPGRRVRVGALFPLYHASRSEGAPRLRGSSPSRTSWELKRHAFVPGDLVPGTMG